MKELNKTELRKIKGGASAGWVVAGIVAGVTFIIGIFDGFTRPFRCR